MRIYSQIRTKNHSSAKPYTVILILSIILILTSNVFPATLNVPADYLTIQTAIDAASDLDTVLVDDGTYLETLDFKGKKITVQSLNGPDHTTIDADYSGSVVSFTNGETDETILMGFTLTHGFSSYGGGIYSANNSNPSVTDCIVSNNTADNGGGICCYQSGIILINCIIKDNRARNNGAGLYLYYLSLTATILNKCTITSNLADSNGGGIYFENFVLCSIVNCVLSDNSARSGGGMFCNISSPDIYNCTICDNDATYTGGIDCYYYSTPAITNTIVYSNTNEQIFEIVYSNATVNYSDVQGGWAGIGTGNIDADPLFKGVGDYHLADLSPCIDSGTAAGAPLDDRDGNLRPAGSGYDMGAYENQTGPNVPVCRNYFIVTIITGLSGLVVSNARYLYSSLSPYHP